MSTVSPRWSAWPCVSRITSGDTSSADAAAFGFPVRNGSVRMVAPPAVSSKQACPRKRMSTAMSAFSFVLVEDVRQLVPDGDADQHAHARLLGDETLDRIEPGHGVLEARGLHHLRLVGGVVPGGRVQRLVEERLER